MSDKSYRIEHPDSSSVTVNVRRDKRLKKSARWVWESDGTILLRIPYRLGKRQVRGLLDDIEGQLHHQQEIAARRTDDDLQARAEHINRTHFDGEIQWNAIRWVNNMNTRLGSCTNGGSTDGHIRISDRIKGWPQWVIDYVIAHELAHRRYPNHSKEFWGYLQGAFPRTERARGFIDGVGFAQGQPFAED